MKIRSYEPTIWDKFLLFSISIAPAHAGIAISIVIFSCFAIVLFVIKNGGLKPSPQAKLVVIIFIIYFFYFYMHGAWIGGSFMAPYESMKGNLPLLFIAVLCLIMSSKNFSDLSSVQVGRWATRALFLSVCFVVIVYLILVYLPVFRTDIFSQMWHDGVGDRLKFYSKNALMFGNMFTVLGFMALIGFQNKTSFEKIYAVFGLLTAIIIVGFWVESRGAILTSALLLILTFWYVRPKIKNVFLLLIFTLSVCFALYSNFSSVALKIDQTVLRYSNGFSSATDDSAQDKDTSVVHRITMYKLGIRAISELPFKGYGYQNRFEAISPYLESNFISRYAHLHNAFINHWVAGGILGLLIFLIFLFTPLALVSFFGKCSRDSIFFACTITISLTGIGMTTEVLGHYVHSTFYGLLICAVALITANEQLATEID